MSEHPEDPQEGGDPNAPLPDDAPPHVKAFYDAINHLLEEISAADPAAGKALTEIWDWMQAHVPERFLRPKPQ
jgi:hypothetical protein